MIKVFLFLPFISILIPSLVQAEYRVYQYSVRTVLDKPYDNQSQLVVSTLNPVAYQAYHGGTDAIEVNIVRTWTCAGYTGNGIDICESPEEQLANATGDLQ